MYKGTLGDKPVAVKVGVACYRLLRLRDLGSCFGLHSPSSSKGCPNLPGRRSALRPLATANPILNLLRFSAQVYEEMKKELEVMTKPKDPNVLVVHGVCAPTL